MKGLLGLLLVYALILLFTVKPFFTRGGRISVVSAMFESNIWLRVSGGLFLLFILIDLILPNRSSVIWWFLPVPCVVFLFGLFKSGQMKSF